MFVRKLRFAYVAEKSRFAGILGQGSLRSLTVFSIALRLGMLWDFILQTSGSGMLSQLPSPLRACIRS